MASSVTFNAEMVCDGCSGAITNIFKKVDGVSEVKIDMDGQKVTVEGAGLNEDDLFEKLQTWGTSADKKVSKVA